MRQILEPRTVGGRDRRAALAFRAFALGAAATFAGCGATDTPSKPKITVGLLLPYTGDEAATTVNFEQAALYAADRINRAGGVQGHAIRIIGGDTHSQVGPSEASLSGLIAAGASLVIGPESADIAPAILPTLRASGVAFVSPVVGAAADESVDCSVPWFRLAQSAEVLGQALGKLLLAQGVGSVTILASTDAYDQALSGAVASRFGQLGGTVVATLQFNPQAGTYADLIGQTVRLSSDAIVLSAPPESAAILVNEYGAAVAQPARWFLSPSLKTDVFVQNVAPAAIEGAQGVAPKVFDMTSAFPDAYAAYWQGDAPLEGAYFYYDAMALVGLALESATIGEDGRVDATSLNAAIEKAAAPPGIGETWNQIEDAIAHAGIGQAVYYSGLTGPMLLDSCGVRELGASTTWKVTHGTITTLQ
jgi:ABC-type branched-subunit amino acid transport system substrate-binding protein